MEAGQDALLRLASEEKWDELAEVLDGKTTEDFTQVDEEGDTVFMMACYAGKSAIVSSLLQDEHADVFLNVANMKGFTGLISAASEGHEDVVEILLERTSIDLNYADNEGLTALMHATRNDHASVVSLLLSLPHVHVNQVDSSQTSAFIHACKLGNPVIVELYVRHSIINFNQADEDGWTGFMWACNDGHKDVITQLVQHIPVDINRTGLRGMSGFLLVCKNGEFELVRHLLDQTNLNVAQENIEGWTAADFISRKLHCAAHGDTKENDEIVDLIGKILARGGLLKHPMSTMECRGECKGAVMNLAEWAFEHKWPKIKEQLRDGYFGDINKPYRGARLLERCSKAGEHEVLALVLQQPDVQIDYVNNERHTALDLAVASKHVECVQLLLAAGASLHHDNMSTLRHLRHGPKNPTKAAEIKLVIEAEEKRRKEYPLHCLLQFRKFDKFKEHLKTGQTSLDKPNPAGMTVLMLAAEEGLVDIAKIVVQNGSDVDMHQGDEDNDVLSQRGSLSSVRTSTENREGDGRTALMYAANRGHKDVVELLLNYLAEVDHVDHTGKTALMMAAEVGSEEVVQVLIEHEADVDIQQTSAADDGIVNNTALAYAAIAGHYEVVEILLESLADTDMVYRLDGKEYTIDELVKFKLKESPTHPLRQNWRTCLDLLKKEMSYRANSTVYVQKLRSKFQALTEDEPFDETLFRRAINAEPSLGRLFLNDCLRVERHELKFSKLELIYGMGDDIQTSALHSLLHLNSDNPDFMFRAKQLLEHVVFQRILALKWEFFAQRLFFEQILSYVVFLISMTISVTLHGSGNADLDDVEISMWAVTLSFSCVGFVAAQLLRPKPLWILARLLYDGKVRFEPMITIPNLSVFKSRARWCILLFVIVGTLGCAIPVLLYVLPPIKADLARVAREGNHENGNVDFVKWVVNGTLFLATCYFTDLEWREFQGDSGTLSVKMSTYFKSGFNCCQLLTYMLILVIYVPHELNLVNVIDDKLILCLGCLLTLGLWILSLQYVAVFRTGGYLLPMMSGILQDVWNFLTFFAVFQIGLTCVFYQMFHNNTDVNGYESFFHAFCTTFFVLFGQFNDDLWIDGSPIREQDPIIYNFSIVLVLLHASVVTVILMNVLLATVNKTVDRGLDWSKVEALWSYAECILRLEVTLGAEAQKGMVFIDVPSPGDIPMIQEEETAPLLVPKSMMTSVRSNSWQYSGILNPAFFDRVSKAELGDDTLKVTKDVEEHVKEWDDCVNDLETATLEELEKVMGMLQRTSHFTTAPYHDELCCMSDAIPKVMHVFMDAKKKRAPRIATKANRLHQMHKKVHRELVFMRTQVSKLPKRPSAALYYKVVHGKTFSETLAGVNQTIQKLFDDVVDKISLAQEQKLSDISNQLYEATKDTSEQLVAHTGLIQDVDQKVQSIIQIDQAVRDQQAEHQAQLLVLQQHVAQQHQLLESMAETLEKLSASQAHIRSHRRAPSSRRLLKR
ncbi:hypothetical protein Ae201684P_016152 [Aphanomyces euteiches]|uniref:Uncharacterized protein n=1 Tax=Aphanomyces euteiches TaxID=100861 RepID=A0A6G0XI89_9STRA|nr:hypothetical protein Ae201684_004493 [Aphanomyces euteiches]KAH9093524.1 hypothetical protein Ae201684P_016152 [Aphanomyces euteiches]